MNSKSFSLSLLIFQKMRQMPQKINIPEPEVMQVVGSQVTSLISDSVSLFA